MTQAEAVQATIENLGGVATLGQINQNIFKITECKWGAKDPFATIRRIVRHNTQGIYRIKPGLYGLESHRKQLEANGYIVETPLNKNSKALDDFNHYYYQGLLVEFGNMKGLKTFVPDQDKNRMFLHQARLGDLRSLKKIPPYTYPHLVKRSSTINVIWFNERSMPHSYFEVEHSTDIQNSLLKFEDLQDFNVRMLIVADNSRRQAFERKKAEAAFKPISRRVDFLSYETLVTQYELEVTMQSMELRL